MAAQQQTNRFNHRLSCAQADTASELEKLSDDQARRAGQGAPGLLIYTRPASCKAPVLCAMFLLLAHRASQSTIWFMPTQLSCV